MVARARRRTSGEGLRSRLLAMVEERPGHGYDLRDRINLGETAADTVAVYRALRALERDGLVESRWHEPRSGPARRVYSVACCG
jgi:DNA-binding PadR family transcriptional regulator